MKPKTTNIKVTLPGEMSRELESFYNSLTLRTIEEKIYKDLQKQARELASEIVSSYDFKQYFKITQGDKIIITSVLTKKKDK